MAVFKKKWTSKFLTYIIGNCYAAAKAEENRHNTAKPIHFAEKTEVTNESHY